MPKKTSDGLPPLRRNEPITLPLKILQFGEGNFLRCFIDWMVDGLNRQGLFGGSVKIVQPLPSGKCEEINAQGGLYTVILRGLENGKPVRRDELITCVSGCLNPYTQWNETVEAACRDTLEFVVSNTTESGIRYAAEIRNENGCPETFPAKVAELLYRRFRHFRGDPGKGLVFLPCELIENNGPALKTTVMQYAGDWKLGDDFLQWIERSCSFPSTLVDRIVPGFPEAEAETLCRELGCDDRLLVTGEPYHLFVIEAPEILDEKLPLRRGGFNVVWTDDLKPYRDRKVRFLNGCHTATALAAHLSGLEYVDEMTGDPLFSRLLRQLLFREIFPTVPLPDDEKRSYAEAVLERFTNPYIKHRLLSISLNSVSKWKVRVLPSLCRYEKLSGTLPTALTFSLAALIVFYDNHDGIGSTGYRVEDESRVLKFFEEQWTRFRQDADVSRLVRAVLEHRDFWDADLRTIAGLEEIATVMTERIHAVGVRKALESCLDSNF